MHILNSEHSLERLRFYLWTRSFNSVDTARIRKRSANKYKKLKIVFIFTLPLNIPFDMVKNNFNISSTISMNIQRYTTYFEHIVSKTIYVLLQQDYILGS